MPHVMFGTVVNLYTLPVVTVHAQLTEYSGVSRVVIRGGGGFQKSHISG